MAIEVGSKVTGKVTGITKFGAFVTLPEGATGLVHISEISDSYVKDVHDFLKVDDEVTVKIISIGGDGKIALSIRQANESSNNGQSGRGHGGPRGGGHRGDGRRPGFEQIMNRFLKDSEERLSALRRNESKRGGRGGRRG
ncbi:RNA binding S1 domain protein [Alicyclobacillus hesperidum URH17-3-68]|uniref:S1 RNA binding domain protein n=1 Tax=Alicyclobacillus hesperidum TaxID=89784 RepID=A0A1H2TM99_9BACL|nr:S1 domain-containing RNA-binding protein [Alicyclobacillus hesperidum]EJY56912.1 RNA binding S1 domain protein [Alicyclobacillus hesperidum URH17-3-68]GLV13898.1 hypothetical protein Heshes_15820 [Alicyclobacillus hesperidum]SDW44825.1 S1 RNA binding domain protein [Alicyclobacillus hesperidum]